MHTQKPDATVGVISNRPPLDAPEVMEARMDRRMLQNGGEIGPGRGICNHFSVLVPGYDDLFIVNPYGKAFAEITASSLLICDFHGRVVSGNGSPEATAFYIHARVHGRLPRARAGFSYPHRIRNGAIHD